MKIDIELTAKDLAEKFCHMGSDEQAEFFEHLHDEVRATTKNDYDLFEMQWLYMTEDIKKNKKAEQMFLAFSSFAYEYWPQKASL